MPSVPPGPLTSLSQPAARWAVRLGNPAGDAPSAADETENLQIVSLSRSAGGDELDSAPLTYDLGKTNTRIMDTQTPTGYSRQVELLQPSAIAAADPWLLFFGELVEQNIFVGDGEGLSLVARLCPWHFGGPLYGPQYRDPAVTADTDEGGLVTHPGDIEFNPEIDGIVEGNRSSLTHSVRGYHFWLDPEMVRTVSASDIHLGAEREDWNLARAVETLCWVCNPDETFLKNPDWAYLTGILEGGEPPEVKNVKLRAGQYLPALLDQLLEPHGFSWYVRYQYTDGGERELTLRFFKLGEGLEKELRHQRPGESLDLKKSNTPEISVETTILEMANVIVCHGARIEREITVELYRGWLEAEDAYTAEELDETTGSEYAAHPNAWRRWVLNEAGDYSQLRDSVAPIPLGAFDLTEILGAETLPRRRKFHDCLTQIEEQAGVGTVRREPFVEWLDENDEWQPIPNKWGAVTLLENECGVFFKGDKPPADLIARGASAKLRITATVVGDARLSYTAERLPSSPNKREIVLHLDVSDRFFDRQVQASGTYASVLGTPSADERDDASALEAYALSVQEVEDAALMRADFTLFGLHHEYEIGDLLTKVKGRNISLNRKSTAAETKRYLQILGITHHYQHPQSTKLHVSAIDELTKGMTKTAGFHEAAHGFRESR